MLWRMLLCHLTIKMKAKINNKYIIEVNNLSQYSDTYWFKFNIHIKDYFEFYNFIKHIIQKKEKIYYIDKNIQGIFIVKDILIMFEKIPSILEEDAHGIIEMESVTVKNIKIKQDNFLKLNKNFNHTTL